MEQEFDHHDAGGENEASGTPAAGIPNGFSHGVRGGEGGPSGRGARGARVLCPYCGLVQQVTARCSGCKGLLDAESRQATQNAMGPWYVRNQAAAHHPGCSYPTLRELVRRGKVTRETILRGPTTAQFWNMAANTPGVAVLLGECHACHQTAREDEYLCRHCGVVLTPRTDRQHLGLAALRPVGTPTSQPPVVSSAPASALSEPTVREGADAAEGGAGDIGVVAGLGNGFSGASGVDAVLARRRAGEVRRRKLMLTGAAAMVVVGVAAVAVVATRGSGKPAIGGVTVPAPAQTPEVQPARVRFAAQIAEAVRLSASDRAADAEAALELLRGVRAKAAGETAPDGRFLGELDRTIEKVRSKLDNARLNDALSVPTTKPEGE